jgi:hypothetical protein
MSLLTVLEKTVGGADRDRFQIQLPDGPTIVSDLIRQCVDFQVAASRDRPPGAQRNTCFVPNDQERALNGDKATNHAHPDVHKQYERAFRAFQTNQIMLLVDGQQLDNLDDEIMIHPASSVTFLKLVPLVGG